MRQVFKIIVVFSLCFSVSAEDEFEPIFNGKNLDGWKTVRGHSSGEHGVFGVNESEEAIHVYAKEEDESRQDVDCLYTETEYSHYELKMEYKWLGKRFTPRADHDRDAGLLFHVHGDFTKIWPYCLEMQLGESDSSKTVQRYTTGDLWVIGKEVQAMNARGDDSFYTPGAELVAVGEGANYDRSLVPCGNEKAHGEWNEVKITVRGAEEAIFELNGKIVNRIEGMSYLVDGKRVALDKGRIGLQAEYAELMYRNIRIKELNPSES